MHDPLTRGTSTRVQDSLDFKEPLAKGFPWPRGLHPKGFPISEVRTGAKRYPTMLVRSIVIARTYGLKSLQSCLIQSKLALEFILNFLLTFQNKQEKDACTEVSLCFRMIHFYSLNVKCSIDFYSQGILSRNNFFFKSFMNCLMQYAIL